MKRDYYNINNYDNENISFFIGDEIEKTDCYGLKTLFIIGIQSPNMIKYYAEKYKVKHIYLGANHSFNKPIFSDELKVLQYCIKKLLHNYKITIDIDYRYIEFWKLILEKFKSEENFFVNISIKFDEINFFKNTTFKFDDYKFNGTSPGVWVYKLKNKDFTSWDEYKKDKIIDN